MKMDACLFLQRLTPFTGEGGESDSDPAELEKTSSLGKTDSHGRPVRTLKAHVAAGGNQIRKPGWNSILP